MNTLTINELYDRLKEKKVESVCSQCGSKYWRTPKINSRYSNISALPDTIYTVTMGNIEYVHLCCDKCGFTRFFSKALLFSQ